MRLQLMPLLKWHFAAANYAALEMQFLWLQVPFRKSEFADANNAALKCAARQILQCSKMQIMVANAASGLQFLRLQLMPRSNAEFAVPNPVSEMGLCGCNECCFQMRSAQKKCRMANCHVENPNPPTIRGKLREAFQQGGASAIAEDAHTSQTLQLGSKVPS